VAGGLAVLAGAALAGCKVNLGTPSAAGTPKPDTSQSAGPSAGPGAGATGTPAPGGSTSPTGNPSVRPCPATALTLAQRPGNDGAAGTIVVTVLVTNRSARACTLRGYPVFTLTAHSASLSRDIDEPVTLRHGELGGPFAKPVTTVTLAPGGKAGFLVAYSNRTASGDGGCDLATKLHLRLPGETVTVVGPVEIQVCIPTLRVSAFLPAAQL
jgi:hypothetical protein